MRLLHICLNGPVTDGCNYQENLLSKYHVKLGYEVYMIAPMWGWNKNGQLEKVNRTQYINEDGVNVIRLEMRGKDSINKTFRRYVGLEDILYRIDPEIVFIHSCAFIDVSVIVKYLKTHKNIVAFADNHADFSNSAKGWISKNILYKIIWRYYAKKLVPYVKKFYGVLPARVDFIKTMYKIPEEKCEYLPMGADNELVEMAQRQESINKFKEEYGIEENDFLIVTGGKIDKWKKQTISLMSVIKNIGIDRIKLIVFGSVDDFLKEELVSLVDKKRIFYLGWLDSKESYSLFAAADLVVFPGRHSVFWEQVAGQGIPMVVKRWTGTEHVDVGGNVIFLETDDKEELKRVIRELYFDSSKLAMMRNVARELGMVRFSYQDIAKNCLK